MTPVVALVGRPNVGKSTLFNRLTRTRDALVADFPGLTRDRKYGQAKLGELEFIVVDTGGIDGTEEGIELKMAEQSLLAIRGSRCGALHGGCPCRFDRRGSGHRRAPAQDPQEGVPGRQQDRRHRR